MRIGRPVDNFAMGTPSIGLAEAPLELDPESAVYQVPSVRADLSTSALRCLQHLKSTECRSESIPVFHLIVANLLELRGRGMVA